MSKKYTTDEVVAGFKTVHGDKWGYEKFIYGGTKISKGIVICPIHGEFLACRMHHMKGSGCPHCANVPPGGFKRKTQEQFLFELERDYPPFKLLDFSKFEYKNNITKGIVICPTHGEFEIDPKHLLKRGHGCPACSGKQKLTIEKIRELTPYQIPDQDYTNNKTHIIAVCELHGEWLVRPDNLLHAKTKCPTCAGQLSEIEDELREFVESELDNTIVRNDKELVGQRKELDILSTKHNIAIEMNGLFCHSEEEGKDKHYHIHKTQRCLEEGIRLFHIYEDEWRNKQEIWKSIIRYNFGKVPNKIHGRKCEIRMVDNFTTNSFLMNNHLQGCSKGSVSLGLYYNDQLVSILSLGRSRFDKNIEWELLRYANVLNTSVVGGFQKLFKHFIRTYNPISIVSYADKRYSIGGLYRSVGMTEIKNDAVNYYYFNKREGVRYSRHQFQKHKLKDKLPIFDDALSEGDNMKMNGFHKIYDCGSYKFVWYR